MLCVCCVVFVLICLCGCCFAVLVCYVFSVCFGFAMLTVVVAGLFVAVFVCLFGLSCFCWFVVFVLLCLCCIVVCVFSNWVLMYVSPSPRLGRLCVRASVCVCCDLLALLSLLFFVGVFALLCIWLCCFVCLFCLCSFVCVVVRCCCFVCCCCLENVDVSFERVFVVAFLC